VRDGRGSEEHTCASYPVRAGSSLEQRVLLVEVALLGPLAGEVVLRAAAFAEQFERPPLASAFGMCGLRRLYALRERA
jgi:hypothetical protein